MTLGAGTHTVHLVGDDGIRLFVDGNLQIDGWKDQGPTEYKKDLVLDNHSHEFSVEYYQKDGWSVAKFWHDDDEGPFCRGRRQ